MRRLVLSVHGLSVSTDGVLIAVESPCSTLLIRGGPDALRLLADAASRAADKLERELPAHPEASEYERLARDAGARET